MLYTLGNQTLFHMHMHGLQLDVLYTIISLLPACKMHNYNNNYHTIDSIAMQHCTINGLVHCNFYTRFLPCTVNITSCENMHDGGMAVPFDSVILFKILT